MNYRFGSKASINSNSRTYVNRATRYLFTSNPTATANHISATLLVAVIAPPATTGPTTALSE